MRRRWFLIDSGYVFVDEYKSDTDGLSLNISKVFHGMVYSISTLPMTEISNGSKLTGRVVAASLCRSGNNKNSTLLFGIQAKLLLPRYATTKYHNCIAYISHHHVKNNPFLTPFACNATCCLFLLLNDENASTVTALIMGTIVIQLYWKYAPNTCKNFAELARRCYYNDVKFHRIIRDFIIQGGDPTGTGKGGSSIYGEKFADEIHEDLKHTGPGIISMANCGPNTNGSQFFITLGPTPWLDGKHTIFGRVYSGMQVVKRIGLTETDKNDRPVDHVKIVKAYIRQEDANIFH